MEMMTLEERLKKFPELRERFEELLSIAENKEGKIKLADDAEDMIIVAGRKLTQTTLKEWSKEQSFTSSKEFKERHKSASKDVKKN